MKNKSKILITILVLEYICVAVLSNRGVTIESTWGTITGIIILFLPLLMLFNMMSKNESISRKRRTVFKILFVFIFICCCAGGVVTVLGINN